MILFQLYALFALATSITGVYELLWPVMTKQESEHGKVDNKLLLYVTFFITCTLVAPLIIFSCLVPSMGIKFREVLQEALFKSE